MRLPWLDALLRLDGRGPIDVLEVMLDDALACEANYATFRRLGSRWPLIGHGVALGIGNADGVDDDYVQAIATLVAKLHVRWYSDHLCFLSAGGVDLGHFAPLAADPETLEVLAENANRVRSAISVPLLLENPADVLGLGASSGAALGASFGACIEAADTGAILDVTNLLYNARNDDFDPLAFIEAMPSERVVQVHVAGGRKVDGLWIDSHDRGVEPESLDLLRVAVRACPNLRAVTLEWDEDLPDFDAVLDQLARVRAVVSEEGRR